MPSNTCPTDKTTCPPGKTQQQHPQTHADKLHHEKKKSSVKKEELLKQKGDLHHVSKTEIHDKSKPNVERALQQAHEKKAQQQQKK